MKLETYTLMSQSQNANANIFRNRVIAIASGKGGVGKTNLAVNLGVALARRGLRVALLDADLGTANVDVVLGLQPRYHLHHVVTGQKSLSEIIVEGPFGLKVIPGASGLPDLADLPEAQRDTLLRALLVLNGTVDLLLIDTSAGVGRGVVQFILAAGEVLIVTTPEPTAITDAYALMKILASYEMPIVTKLTINNARQRGEGEATGHKLANAAYQFLGRQVEIIGTLPHDKSVLEAIRKQSSLMQTHPYSPAARAIDALGEKLWTGTSTTQKDSGISRFLQQILSIRNNVIPTVP